MRFKPSRQRVPTAGLDRTSVYALWGRYPKAKESDLSSVRRWVSGGAPLPLDVLQRFEALTGQSPNKRYGLTGPHPVSTGQVA